MKTNEPVTLVGRFVSAYQTEEGGNHYITLPSLKEMRDFYAALNGEERFGNGYLVDSCLIALPYRRESRDGIRVDRIEVWPHSLSGSVKWFEFSADGVITMFRCSASLPPVYGRLAIAFDELMGRSGVEGATFAQCVALIDGFIAEEEMNDAR